MFCLNLCFCFFCSNLIPLGKYLNQCVSMSIFMIKITTIDRNAPPWNADESNIVDPVFSLSSDLRCLLFCNRLISVHKYRIYYLVLVVQMQVKCSIAPCTAVGSLGLDTRFGPVAGARGVNVLCRVNRQSLIRRSSHTVQQNFSTS